MFGGVLVDVLGQIAVDVASSCLTARRAISSLSLRLGEKLRYLQLKSMGGQAVRRHLLHAELGTGKGVLKLVARTMESSQNSRRCPLMNSEMGSSFILATCLRF